MLNVTVTEPTAPGFITVYPCGQTRPLASNVNFAAGATVANTVIAKLSSDGTVCIYSSATTHMVVDTTAYVPGSATSIVGVLPARLLETRSGPGMSTVDGLFQGGGTVSPTADVRVQIAGRGGVVADAGSALLNVTVTEPVAAGFITVYPCDRPRPLASSVNFTADATVANAVITKLAPDGTVCLHSSVPTHLVVDVNGYTE